MMTLEPEPQLKKKKKQSHRAQANTRNERLAIARLQQTSGTATTTKKKYKKCYTVLRRNAHMQAGCSSPKRLRGAQPTKKKQLHRAHATTSQRTAGYRKVATD
jgi:hypothetical protein